MAVHHAECPFCISQDEMQVVKKDFQEVCICEYARPRLNFPCDVHGHPVSFLTAAIPRGVTIGTGS